MNRNKNKQQYGSFAVSNSGSANWRKTVRNFVAAMTAVIFVFGGALAIYKYNKKPGVVSQAVTTVVSEIPGWWYQKYFKSSVCSKDECKLDADPDQDKLSNDQEYYYHSDPLNAHTVGDEMTDGELVANNFDPSRTGRITFDSVTEDENILGESLLFNSDLTQLLNESVDLNAVMLPEVNEQDLKISADNSRESVQIYLQASNKMLSKHFPAQASSYIASAAASPDPETIAEIKSKCDLAAAELQGLIVPSEFLQIHKYGIMLLNLLPDVINVPDQSALANEYDPAGNAWFDKTQALMSVYQKMDLETKRLQNKFK